MSKEKLARNTPEEEVAVQRGIAVDSDNPEWTAEDFAQARLFREVMAERKRIDRPPKGRTPHLGASVM